MKYVKKLNRIGFDLDNTTLNYDFAAIEFASLHASYSQFTSLQALKKGSRHLNDWVNVQSWIYAIGIRKAVFEDTFLKTIQILLQRGYIINLVSHKTKYPNSSKYLPGEFDLNLRSIALSRLEQLGLFEFLEPNSIFFCDTLEAKINTINNLNFAAFVDDLEKVLTHEAFPSSTSRILYQPKDERQAFYRDDRLQKISRLDQLFQVIEL